MGVKDAFDIGDIPSPVSDRFHDDQVCWRGQSHHDATHVGGDGSGEQFFFDKQLAKRDVHIDAGGLVAEQEHA